MLASAQTYFLGKQEEMDCQTIELSSKLSAWESKFAAEASELHRIAVAPLESELAAAHRHVAELTSACAQSEKCRAEDIERNKNLESEAGARFRHLHDCLTVEVQSLRMEMCEEAQAHRAESRIYRQI